MRLNTAAEEERAFAQWQLDIGHGRQTYQSNNVQLPEHFKCPENNLTSFINTIYPNIASQEHSDAYFSNRIILSSRNDDVDEINQIILNQISGEEYLFHSADSLPNNNMESEDGELRYPV
jgi:hypothetical protein